MRKMVEVRPSVKAAVRLQMQLFRCRGGKPTAENFENLILANCDAELGSLEHVDLILREMERERVHASPTVYTAVLKVRSATYSHAIDLDQEGACRPPQLSVSDSHPGSAPPNMVVTIRAGRSVHPRRHYPGGEIGRAHV